MDTKRCKHCKTPCLDTFDRCPKCGSQREGSDSTIKTVFLNYDGIDNFSNGLAHVWIKGRHGFLDRYWNEAITLKYDDARPFSEGFAQAALSRPDNPYRLRYGFIDTSGKELAPFEYDYCSPFRNGTAIVELNGRKGVMNRAGVEIIQTKYLSIDPFRENAARIKIRKYGFIDSEGNEIIQQRYDDAADFAEGLAPVYMKDRGWGFVDKTGTEIVRLKYDRVVRFSEGIACIKNKGKYECIDRRGTQVAGLKPYDYPVIFSGGVAVVGRAGKYGFVNIEGSEIIPLIYAKASNFSEGFSCVTKNGRTGYIDIYNNETIPFRFDKGSDFSDGLARVYEGRKCYLINKRGIPVSSAYDEIRYDKKYLVNDDYVQVGVNRKYGFIDKTGKEIIPPKYDYNNAAFFGEGMVRMRLNDKSRLINTAGVEVCILV